MDTITVQVIINDKMVGWYNCPVTLVPNINERLTFRGRALKVEDRIFIVQDKGLDIIYLVCKE